MKRRRVFLIGAVVLAATGLGVVAGMLRADYSQPARESAARFLGVESDELEFLRRTEDSRFYSRGVLEEWRWSDARTGDVVDVTMVRDGARVVMASWNETRPSEGEPQVTREDALAVALGWARRFPAFRPEEEPEYMLKDFGDQRAAHQFRWRGAGPGAETHSIRVMVDVVTGRPVACSAIYWPPQPEPTMPIRISRERAREIAIAAADKIEGLRVESIRASAINTRSPYRPEGEPVYVVSIEGWIVPRGATEECGYANSLGVHATTGEVLTKQLWEDG